MTGLGLFLLFLSIGHLNAGRITVNSQDTGSQNGCNVDEFVHPDTGSCSSCKILCSNGQNERICGSSCHDYFQAKAVGEWQSNQNLTNYQIVEATKKSNEEAIAAQKMAKAAIAMTIFSIIINILLVIGLLHVKYDNQTKHYHGQPNADPHNQEYRT